MSDRWEDEMMALQCIFDPSELQISDDGCVVDFAGGHLRIKLPLDYPDGPVVFLRGGSDELRHEDQQMLGESRLFSLIERYRELQEEEQEEEQAQGQAKGALSGCEKPTPAPFTLPVFQTTPIVEQKSKFVAFACRCSSLYQVEAFREHLMLNASVRNATHNVMAWRVEDGSGNDDDGEGGASSKLLFLLETGDYSNIAVVVTRWYGGVKLGGLRFKLFKQEAKKAIVGLVESKSS